MEAHLIMAGEYADQTPLLVVHGDGARSRAEEWVRCYNAALPAHRAADRACITEIETVGPDDELKMPEVPEPEPWDEW